MVFHETIIIGIGIVASTVSIMVAFWKLNNSQKQEIKEYVNDKIENPDTGLRKCIDDKARKLEDKIVDVKTDLVEKIGEVKGGVNELKTNHANLLQAFNNHLKEAEGITKLGTAKIREFDETKKDVDTLKLSIINLQHWQTDEMKRQSIKTE